MQMGLSLNAYGSAIYGYNNNVLTKANSESYTLRYNLSKYKQKKYSISFGFGPSYNITESTPHSSADNKAAGAFIDSYTTIYLPGKFQISSNFNDTYAAKTSQLPSTNRSTWDASLGKTFLKDDNLKFSLACNNILNQGFNYRSAYGNMISQVSNNSILRYFMFTVTWDFTKFGTIAAKK